MIHYILQTIAFQLVFLLAYDVFLKRDTFFKWNRLYLLATAILSIILPFIKVDSFKKVVPEHYIIALPEVVLGQPAAKTNNTIALDAVVLKQNSMPFWEIIFYIGLGVAFCLFLFKVFKIFALVVKNPKQSMGNIILVELLNSNAAFSFFHYIFLGERIKAEDKEAILKHELIHAQQKHTLDLLFFEVLRIVFWFNPLVYMYQNRMATLHEFIADAHAVKHQNKNDYYQNLLAQVFKTKNISFINTFFKQSLIKKRIVMLSKTKSKQIHLLKYALLIPLVFGMLVYTSAEAQEKTNKNETSQSITNSQDLPDEALKEKLRNELKKMKADGADFEAIANAFMIKTDKYILNREEYYRLQIYFEEIASKSQNKNTSAFDRILNRIYPEYLEYKKTDEAKETWENNTHDGVLKLIVNDLDNLTSEEKKKYNKKKNLLFNDDFFTKFIMTNGKKTVTVETTKPTKEKEQDYNNDIEVPFAVIDQVPVYPGCEDLSREDQKKCISENITKHVQRNFNTSLANTLGLTGRQRINVIFKIDANGHIKGIRSRAPHPDLEAEAIRVIKTLPKMIPGKQKGKNVTVPYSLPIIFEVADKTAVDEAKTVAYGENNKKDIFGEDIEVKDIFREEDIEVPFSVIENVPVYPGCEEGNNAEKKKCMSEKISNFVAENFNTKIADENGLSGRQRINVIFKIDKEGHVTGVRSRAAHPALETEATRVISSFPKMKPGTQRGKAVITIYSLPILFNVEEKTKMLDEVVINDDTDANIDVPFAVVDEPPIFPGCEDLNKDDQKKCFANGVSTHVNKNFNSKLPKTLGLTGRQRINVIFKIDTGGDIQYVKSRASHPDLETEAIRVIKSLPKIVPGMQRGKKVNVLYSLPIIFQVAD